MYYTKSVYKKRANYASMDTLVFFAKANALANQAFKEGKRVEKKEQIVVYGSSVKGFDPKTDGSVLRVELNSRGPLRDFIGIDWDFDKREDYKALKERICALSKEYQTPILFYPTTSYPTKPHCRTIFFLEEAIDAMGYAKAETWVEQKLGLDPEDEGNSNIKHPINAPSHCSKEAYEESGWYVNGKFVSDKEHPKEICEKMLQMKRLPSSLWEKTKPKNKRISVGKELPTHRVTNSERNALTDEEVQKGWAHLKEEMKKDTRCDFTNYNNFFQFLHALARAEVVGRMTHQQAVNTLIFIAQGNRQYEQNNIKDYEVEFARVRDSQEKLEKALPITNYFGPML